MKGWVTTPTSNNGFLLRMRDEADQTARAMLLSSEGAGATAAPDAGGHLPRADRRVHLLRGLDAAGAHPERHLRPAGDGVEPDPRGLEPDRLGAVLRLEAGRRRHRRRRHQLRVAYGAAQEHPAGGTVDVTAQVKTPPSSTEGNKRTDYVLQWQLRTRSPASGCRETTPIKALPQNVAVEEPTSDQLGLEKFYSYAGKNTGAGGALMNNLYAGNTVWSYNAFSNPSRGLSTFVRLAYNSLDTSRHRRRSRLVVAGVRR